MVRKVFLDGLPKWESGSCKGKINWIESVGYFVKFIYDNIEGEIKILNYDKSKQKIEIIYKDKVSKIHTSMLANANLSFIIDKRHKEHKYLVDDIIQLDFYPFKIIEQTRSPKSKNNNWMVKSYTIKCMGCGSIYKNIKEDGLERKGRVFKCKCCNDGFSFPEKLMYNILKQLGISFKTQQSFKWSEGKVYDFYIPNLKVIIETNGQQHYVDKKSWNINKENQLKNDELKMNLALNNGIKHYIQLDCSESNIEFIKENMLKSKMTTLFNLDDIDWIACNNNASSSLAKTACDLWNNNTRSSVKIAEILNISKQSVITYLKQFAVLELCDYDPKEEMRQGNRMTSVKKKKSIICLDNGIVFDSSTDCARLSKDIFGIELHQGCISATCRGAYKHHKGYHFMFYKDYLAQQQSA